MLRTSITTNSSFTRPLTVLLLATFHEKQTKHDSETFTRVQQQSCVSERVHDRTG